MHELADTELLTRAATGDSVAFDVLYRRHSSAVARYAWTWCSTEAEMQDIVQETFITAWKKADSIHLASKSALPWLLVTCRHHAANHTRKVVRRREVPLDGAAEHSNRPNPATERLAWVMETINTLDELDQRLCQLCLVEGYSYKEAARELGRSVAWVGKRLQRARVQLRKAEVNHEQN